MRLTSNVRVDAGEQDFANWLQELGSGNLPLPTNQVLPENSVIVPPVCLTNDIVSAIYGNLLEMSTNMFRQMSEKVILCPRNDNCDTINSKLLDKFPGNAVTIMSADSIETDDEEEKMHFPEEYLNSITPNGMPNHKLMVKQGVPVILLRNLSLKDGLINGT